MSIGAFVVALALGAALLAIWAVVRFPRMGPETLTGALVQITVSFLSGLILVPLGMQSALGWHSTIGPLAGANATEVVAGLERSATFLKGLLAREVQLRNTPNLVFALDGRLQLSRKPASALGKRPIGASAEASFGHQLLTTTEIIGIGLDIAR